jgi:putative hydrolase of the HAD superfamily
MIALENIKNIIFDLGGVILNIDYAQTANAFKDLGFADFDNFYSQKEQTTLFNNLETGEISETFFVSSIQKHIPLASKEEIIKAWNRMLLDLPKDRVNLLNALKKNFRIFLLSNTNEIHEKAFTENTIEQYGKDILSPCFEKVYYSHKLGKRKPDREAFLYILNAHDLIASETLFIDDSIQHVIGAQRVGIQAYHLDISEETIMDLFPDKAQ